MTDANTAVERPVSPVISGIEFLVGAAIVIGHNVFHVVPNEVPILFVLAFLSTRIRERRWSALGFKRPSSWLLVIGLAVGAAALRIVLGDFVIDPLTSQYFPEARAPEGADDIVGNPTNALIALGLVWTFAAFGEEIGYRGYLTKRAADVGGGAWIAWWIATIAVSVLFGYGHSYKGIAGVIDSGIAGFILGAAFLLSGRCLWTTILAHGLIDTFAVGVAYLGLDA